MRAVTCSKYCFAHFSVILCELVTGVFAISLFLWNSPICSCLDYFHFLYFKFYNEIDAPIYIQISAVYLKLFYACYSLYGL